MPSQSHRGRPEKGILALPNGRFRYVLRFKGRLYKRTYDSKAMAKAQRAAKLTELRAGILPQKAPTLEAATGRFLEWSESSCSAATHGNDRWVSALWLASPHLRKKTLDRITAGDVQKFKEALLVRTRPAPKKAGEGAAPVAIGPRSTDVALARLRRLFSLCVAWKLTRENPAKEVALVREDTSRVRYLTEDEEADLLGACPPRLARLVRLAILTGMRKEELLRLCPREVDLKAGVARLQGARTKSKVYRTVPLSPEAVQILRTMSEGRKFEPPKPPEKPPPPSAIPYFANRYGKKDWRLDIAFLAAVRKAGLHDFTFHDLRHTFASRLVMAGVNLRTVQKLLGHATVQMTMRYAHLAPGAEAEAVKLISKGGSIQSGIQDGTGAPESAP